MPVQLANGDPSESSGITRRGVLRLAATASAGAATGLGGGCAPFSTARWRDAPDRIADLRASAGALANQHDGVINRYPQLADLLTPLRDAHRKHVEALDRQLPDPGRPGPAPVSPTDSGTGPTDDPTVALAALRSAETAGVQQAATLCVTGPGWRAALVGSIAAARASHVEVLT